MMDDITLCHLIYNEREHFAEIEKRRKRAVLFNESKDILAHYDDMQSRSMKIYSALVAEKYRRENEQK